MEPAASFELGEHDGRPCRHEELVQLAIDSLSENDLALLLDRATEFVAVALGVESASVVELTPDGLRAVRSTHGPPLRTCTGSALSANIAYDESRIYGYLSASTVRDLDFGPGERRCVDLVARLIGAALRRLELELSLRTAEQLHRALFAQLPLVAYTDVVGERVENIYASPQIEGMTGYSPEEWRADPDLFATLLHPDDRERVLREHDELRRSGEVLESEYRLVRRDGRVVRVEDRAVVVRRDATGQAYLHGVLMDVTERHRLEAQAAQAQKLAEIGRLAAGVAHDFNNVLTAIIGFAELTLGRLGRDGEVREEVEQIAAAGRRGALLTRQLLEFARARDAEPVPVRIDEVVGRAEGLLRLLLSADVRLVTRPNAPRAVVRADPIQLEQVLVNLAVNARDAMPEGGTILIETRAEPGTVTLVVSDTGVGMDEATTDQIFEPFFTTKGPERGTGLGLATVRGVVGRAGGSIDVKTSPGNGTTFTITLPAEPEEAGTTT